MTTIKRRVDTFDIDSKSFNVPPNLEGYLKTYYLEGSLNIASEVPILILENIPITSFSGGHFSICVGNTHAFYNIFKTLSKDNKYLHDTYFKEKYGTKLKEKITLTVYYEEKQKPKFLKEKRMWCKLDIQIKISHYEGLFYEGDRDSEYVDRWSFRLDLNKIEFV